eukprot:jgi/Chlat1/8889/Chrsp92S08204
MASFTESPAQQQQQGDDDSDGGGASLMVDSYAHPGFAKFYDTFIDNLPPEYEVSESSALCCMLLERAVRAKRQRIDDHHTNGELVPITVLDLASGTGRVILALLHWWFSEAARELVQPFTLRIIANDSSPLMIAEARHKLQQVHQSIIAHERKDSYSIRWVEGDMSQMRDESIKQAVDVAFLCAGSIHHLLARASQQQLMDNLHWHMLPHPDSRAVLNLFGIEEFTSYEELNKEASAVLTTGEYERVHVRRVREHATDSMLPADIIILDEYRLIKLKATSQEEATIEWSAREGWSLRSITHEDLRRMADSAGLRVLHESERFAGVMGLVANQEGAAEFDAKGGGGVPESDGYQRRSRVFVLGVKGC